MDKSTFIQHYRDIPQWLEQSPIAFALLSLFARRARRIAGNVGWNGENIYLESREFITGRKSVSHQLGITEGKYRSAYEKLIKNELIRTIRSTKRYTIGLYCADKVFSINIPEKLPSEQPSEKPTNNQQLTTNNNDKNDNNGKLQLEQQDKLQEKSPYKKILPTGFLEPSLHSEYKGLEKLRDVVERRLR